MSGANANENETNSSMENVMKRQLSKVLGTSALAGMFLLAACGTAGPEGEEQPEISQNAIVSDCGGFQTAQAMAGGLPDEQSQQPIEHQLPDVAGYNYCDAELLHWSYDSATQQLSLLNSRIELNCCGLHDIQIQQQNGVYVITETDAPEMMGRCGCMCVFDYALDAQGIPEQSIPVRVMRHVTDNGGPYVVFEGELDLTQGSGVEVIDDEPSMWCELSI